MSPPVESSESPWNLVYYQGKYWHHTGLQDYRGKVLLNSVHPDKPGISIAASPEDIRHLDAQEHARQTAALSWFWSDLQTP